MAKSKTIQIFLKDSNPEGVKIADLSNSLVRIYVIPREEINYVRTRPDLAAPAIYMLFDDERTNVYIGESENFSERIVHHIVNKHFWRSAVVCVASGSGLDKADVKFLESHAIQKAIEIGRFTVQNRTNPGKNNLHEFKLSTVLDLFDDFELLLSTLGFNLFESVRDETLNEALKDPKSKENEKDTREYDTIICPATGNGRVDAFEKKSAWWAVRIGKNNIPKLKHIGLYESAPIGAIRYYANITKIEPYPETPGKYIIYHDGNIQTLKNPVILGNNPELSLYGPRYYKLEDLVSSKTLAELTDKTFGSDHRNK